MAAAVWDMIEIGLSTDKGTKKNNLLLRTTQEKKKKNLRIKCLGRRGTDQVPHQPTPFL